MTNATAPTIGYDRYDERWTINGDHLDYPVALKVLARAGMSCDAAADALMRVRPTEHLAPTVAVPVRAMVEVEPDGHVAIYDGDRTVVRLVAESEDAARALVQAAQAEARRWGLVV